MFRRSRVIAVMLIVIGTIFLLANHGLVPQLGPLPSM